MKKLAIALAMLGFAGAASAAPVATSQDYRINYQGRITSAACVIQSVSSQPGQGITGSDTVFSTSANGGAVSLTRRLGDDWLPSDITAVLNGNSLSDKPSRDILKLGVKCERAAEKVAVSIRAGELGATAGKNLKVDAVGAAIAIGDLRTATGQGQIYDFTQTANNYVIDDSGVAISGTDPIAAGTVGKTFTLVASIVKDGATAVAPGNASSAAILTLAYEAEPYTP